MSNDPVHQLFQPCPALQTAAFAKFISASSDKFGTGSSPTSAKIFATLRLNASVCALLTHVAVSPGVPAVVAIESILAVVVGEEAFDDDMKQYTGWRVRQIIEFLGGSWVRAGVRIRASRYKTGSTYTLGDLSTLLAV
ncbi:MAG TPA: hypothetical protein VIT38_07580 [Allosphingosinicella sp.]